MNDDELPDNLLDDLKNDGEAEIPEKTTGDDQGTLHVVVCGVVPKVCLNFFWEVMVITIFHPLASIRIQLGKRCNSKEKMEKSNR